MIDRDTIEGDYREAWQHWYHKTKSDKTKLFDYFGQPILYFLTDPPSRVAPDGWVKFVRSQFDSGAKEWGSGAKEWGRNFESLRHPLDPQDEQPPQA